MLAEVTDVLGPPKGRGAVTRPVLAALEALVPAGCFYRHLERRLDLGFVRELVRDRYAPVGRPGIDPVVFFKLQLIMFFEGIRSERKLVETASLNLAHRWYLGYALDEPLPDHSSLTRISGRLGLAVFRRFFERVMELCQEAGLVWGRELFFDATGVRANADVDSLVPRLGEVVGDHVRALFGRGEDREEEGRGAPGEKDDEEPAAASTDGAAGEADAPRRWDLLEECRLDPRRPSRHGYRRLSDQVVSRTDPNAASMGAGGPSALGYHDHYVVDGGRARCILHALVTPADVMENQPMLDLLWRVRFRWKLHPRRAVGDTTYGTADNIRALEDAGIRAYVPLPNWEERTPYYGHAHFLYDPARDEYRCPQGQPLARLRTKYTEGVVVYRASAATCNACAAKAACTASDEGRQVTRSFHAAYLDRVRAYHATAAYKKAMRKRAVWVEPLFGEAKQWHGLRQFRLRGLGKVNAEALLVAAGQNLKRWLAATGWGRRHAPCGALTPPPRSTYRWPSHPPCRRRAAAAPRPKSVLPPHRFVTRGFFNSSSCSFGAPPGHENGRAPGQRRTLGA